MVDQMEGKLDDARARAMEALNLAGEVDAIEAEALHMMSAIDEQQGARAEARQEFLEGMSTLIQPVHPRRALEILPISAYWLAFDGRAEDAVRIRGCEAAGRRTHPGDCLIRTPGGDEAFLRRLRVGLGEETFERRWTDGEAMSLDEAVALAAAFATELRSG